MVDTSIAIIIFTVVSLTLIFAALFVKDRAARYVLFILQGIASIILGIFLICASIQNGYYADNRIIAILPNIEENLRRCQP